MQLQNLIARANVVAVVVAVALVDDEEWYPTMGVVDSAHLVSTLALLEKLPLF